MWVLVAALTWPLADLATRSLLLAQVVQRLILVLAVPPLLVAGLPKPLLAAVTRPEAVDAPARWFTRPVPAVVAVTVVAVATLSFGWSTRQPPRW